VLSGGVVNPELPDRFKAQFEADAKLISSMPYEGLSPDQAGLFTTPEEGFGYGS
jgi:hypothetical protein